jgi:hypothetical protein
MAVGYASGWWLFRYSFLQYSFLEIWNASEPLDFQLQLDDSGNRAIGR